MPTISSFYGILIRMFYNDHDPPYFHALYGEFQATVAIDELGVLEGELPRRALDLVLDWAELHQDELRENWRLARANPAPKQGCDVEVTRESGMYWDIVEVRAERDYCLWLRFADGVTGTVRLDADGFTGVLEPLRNPEFFEQVYLELGAVPWPGEID